MKSFVAGKKSLNINKVTDNLQKIGNKNTNKYGKQLKNSDNKTKVLQYSNKQEIAKRVAASGAGYVLGRALMKGYTLMKNTK